jgi:hypothetical protein
MPKLYKYLGIVVVLYLDDHNPIHVHAVYGNAEVKVLLYEKDGVVHTVRYQEIRGKFSPAKLRDLKTFISKHKNAILFAYNQIINEKTKFKTIEITKRIK